MGTLQEAVEIATKHHEGQVRKNGEPYISHPLRVLSILLDLELDEEALIAAVLHDICAETDFKNSDVFQTFGPRVGYIVNALSKNKKPTFLENKEDNDDYNHRFLLYMNRFYSGIQNEPFILFVKMGDQLDNLKTLDVFDEDKQVRKLNEITEYFMPMYERAAELLEPELEEKYQILKRKLEILMALNKERLNLV
ncbi:MAG: guanosine-3',5'-bis(diphosphate) 3'-pyrophosphohydrolase [Oceanicoccus sp.]|jgi:guanosine-3',5'-bis(diphosphate) 3'-pyrophosphohydrolase